MIYPDLQTFLTDLDARGQLKRVRAAVDPVLEIPAIADRVCKLTAAGDAPPPPTDPIHGRYGGHALLFENVIGHTIPVAINVLGSYERMRLALGVSSFEEVADRLRQLLKPEMPTSLIEKVKMIPQLAKLAGFGPKTVKRGMCQEVVHIDDASLFDLPIIQCWPHDGQPGFGGKPGAGSDPSPLRRSVAPSLDPDDPRGMNAAARAGHDPRGLPTGRDSAPPGTQDSGTGTGRYITFAGVYTKDPASGACNVGMYRVQVFDRKLAAVHWHMHHDGARHFRKYKTRGERMPVALVLGGEPVLPYVASCPLPPDVSELTFAGFLNGGGIELVACKTIPMEVPASAEIVIEGWVEPEHMLVEGPFGDHTGFYSHADCYPALHVSAITHRHSPVFPATIVGFPPQEDYYLGKVTERIFLPLLQIIVPDILDYSLPMFGAFHNCVFVRIRKEYPMQARKVINSILGAGQLMFSKMIVVVDEHVNVHDEQDVLFRVGANVDWRRDTVIVDGPCDVLDHAAPNLGSGSKIGIDATRKVPGEGQIRDWPEELKMSDEVLDRVWRRWAEYGL